MNTALFLFFVCITYTIYVANAASKTKPHGHTGVLEPYDGKQIPCKVTKEQESKLDKGEPVQFTEKVGKSGRGVVIQDINASNTICMDRIRDLKNYPKMVPHVKSVDIYQNTKTLTGAAKTGAKFEVGVLGMKFGYFLLLTHEPRFNTLTWTLDYKYNSDFDDNVGHWQVMPHPKKAGWTRLLYSTKLKLFPWIPSFIVSFLTTKALVESTSWVKKESEADQIKVNAKKGSSGGGLATPDMDKLIPSWLKKKGGHISDWKPSIRLPTFGC